jgi:hypothetical protein
MFRVATPAMPVTLRRFALVALACSAVMLQGCGGGNRAKAYQPGALVAFGDENSAISSQDADGYSGTLTDASNSRVNLKGLTFTVNTVVSDISAVVCANNTALPSTNCTSANAVDSATATTFVTDPLPTYKVLDTSAISSTLVTQIERDATHNLQRTRGTLYYCSSSTIWVQAIAHNFGLGFDQSCPMDRGGAKTYAAFGATVADVAAQVAAHRGELASGVLVTIMVGQNDIMSAYKRVKHSQPTSMTQDAAIAELTGSAVQLSSTVADVLSTGAKVVLSLVPDLGESPLVLSAATASSEDRDLLKALTKTFNDKVFSVLAQNQPDGRKLAFVEPVLFTNPSTRSSSYVYDTALCNLSSVKRPDGTTVASNAPDYSVRLKYCQYDSVNATGTLVTNGSTATYMWADSTHFAPLGHLLIGSAGATRAANQF